MSAAREARSRMVEVLLVAASSPHGVTRETVAASASRLRTDTIEVLGVEVTREEALGTEAVRWRGESEAGFYVAAACYVGDLPERRGWGITVSGAHLDTSRGATRSRAFGWNVHGEGATLVEAEEAVEAEWRAMLRAAARPS